MREQERIEKGLADIQARHKGKPPSFGPLEDLMELYGTLDREGKGCMLSLLRDRATDPFWTYFVEAVLQKVRPSEAPH